MSNELFTVKGRAGDNVSVTNVYVRLTNSLADTGWLPASSGNSLTNWSADLDLTPGTNTIAAYAVDASGNLSATNTIKFKYVLSGLLTVSTNGKGGISPAYNGALLAIGKTYTLTATPKPTYTFVNWTDGDGLAVTNKPALTFQMASNLSFTANFVDTNRPGIVITTPTAATIATSEFYVASGKTTDNAGVTNVYWQLNGGDWFDAHTTNHWTNWNITLDLPPGTNSFAAYAVDSSGNLSVTNPVKFIYNTAPASLSGLKAAATDGNNYAFGAGLFSLYSTNPVNGNGVGSYTYTKLTPSGARLKLTYTAPPSMTNLGVQTNNLAYSAPNVAQFDNNGIIGGIGFTSTPVLAVASLLNKTVVHVDNDGSGKGTFFTAGKFVNVNLLTGATDIGTNYAYTVYSPLGALLKFSSTNGTFYNVVAFLGTNYGATYEENYDAAGIYTGSGTSVFGVASQRAGGNAPTNLVNHSALVTSVGGSFKLAFPDGVNFAQLNPVDDTVIDNGTYAYARAGTNTGSLDLNYTVPPNFSSLLHFIAPNLAYFTNADSTVGAAVFK